MIGGFTCRGRVNPPSCKQPLNSLYHCKRTKRLRISPNRYVALYGYKPAKDDELELVRNENYFVTEKCKDGWFKGYSATTQKRGVFPGNYVRLAR